MTTEPAPGLHGPYAKKEVRIRYEGNAVVVDVGDLSTRFFVGYHFSPSLAPSDIEHNLRDMLKQLGHEVQS